MAYCVSQHFAMFVLGYLVLPLAFKIPMLVEKIAVLKFLSFIQTTVKSKFKMVMASSDNAIGNVNFIFQCAYHSLLLILILRFL